MTIGIAAPFDRRAIENAIAAWIKRATGVTFIWANQNGARPAFPYITGMMSIANSIGQDEQRIDGDPPNPQVGQEVEIAACGLRKLVVSLNAYAGPNGDPEIDDARQHMDKARAALGLPSFVEDFRAAGMAIVQDEAIQNLDQLDGDTFLSRTQMDVSFCIASNAIEHVGYIATAEVTATDLGWNPEIFEVET